MLRMRSDASSGPSSGLIARPYARQSVVRSRRRQVIPEPKPSSWGRNSQRIRYEALTGSRTAPCDYPDAYDLDAADYAGRPAAAARSAPTMRRRSPAVWQRSSSSRLARALFGEHQRELPYRHFRGFRNLPWPGVASHGSEEPDDEAYVLGSVDFAEDAHDAPDPAPIGVVPRG